MKKLSIILAFCALGSFNAVQASEGKGIIACIGVYGLNLGVVGYKTGSVDLIDVTVALTSAMLATNYLQFSPKTIQECKINMAMQGTAGALMLGRLWYKTRNRPVGIVPLYAQYNLPHTMNISEESQLNSLERS